LEKTKTEQAVEMFGPFDCSQAILAAWCGDYGLEKETALKLSCGLAAGMARLGYTCGAVTGAYLVIGLVHGKSHPGDSAAKEKTFALVQEFDRRFREKHGSTNCTELLGIDLRDSDRELVGRQVREKCHGYVRDAAEILEAILG